MPRAGAFPVPGGLVDDTEEHHISEPRINDRIRVAEVRLVGPNGEQVGIVRVEDALRLAQDADLDLVEVAPDARPPVVKIMDFGKFKYEADMKAREARRNQTNTILKEIRFRLKIDPHDYATKKGHVERFLKGGDKVKVMIMFRGREQSRPEMGVRLLQRLADDVIELGFIESMPKQDGRNMIMVLGPTKKKTEQRRAAQTHATKAPAQQDASDAAPAPDAVPALDAAPSTAAASVPTVAAPAPAVAAARAPARTAAPAAPSPEPATAVTLDTAAAPTSVAPAAVVVPDAPDAPAAVVVPDAPVAVVVPDAKVAPAAAAAPAAATPTRPAPRPAPSPRPAPASRPSTATRPAATGAGGGSRSASASASASTGTSAPRTSSATRPATTSATTSSTTAADTPAAPRPATPRPGPRATPTARAKPATPRGQAPTEGAG